MDANTEKNINLWLTGSYDDETKAQIREMVNNDPKNTIDAFYSTLSFGTGGMRGLMGIGSNRMNPYTVRAATQGLVNYIHLQESFSHPLAVLIGYDSRNHSKEFAEEAAKVLAGNGIIAYLFKEIRPTPLVSFGCRYKKCIAAIMITASHNPSEYNGYKVYWADGGQLVPPHDTGVIAEVVKVTDPKQVKITASLNNPLIHILEDEVDNAYIKAVEPLQNYPTDNKLYGHRLKIVYTSLHGTGITILPKALHSWGFTNISLVAAQVIPDGNFPTAKYPNPEEKAALKLGIDQLLQTESDILIATDPDADRVGVVCLHDNTPIIFTGNQVAALCLAHLCEALSIQKKWPARSAFIKTIGTTELFQAICDRYKKPCFNVLTGFKYIAELIHSWEIETNGNRYIFGGEESYGYLLGTEARDKDAVISSALIAEVALQAKRNGKTLLDKLYDLYGKYGVYEEGLLSINFGETKEGKDQMSASMKRLRATALTEINGQKVIAIEDYLISKKIILETSKEEVLILPKSDVLLYWLEDGTKIMIRPSGTEPKVKLYCGVVEKNFSSIEKGIETAKARCQKILEEINKLLR